MSKIIPACLNLTKQNLRMLHCMVLFTVKAQDFFETSLVKATGLKLFGKAYAFNRIYL